jgi:hypothetical protein
LSLTALLAAAALPALLALVGSRLAPWLAAPEDGALYRATLYGMSGAVLLHLVVTLLDFVGIPWRPWLLAALGAALFGLALRFLPRGPHAASGDALGWGDGTALFVLATFTALALSGWITFGDFIFHWGIKGERFALARGIDYAYLARGWNWVLHPDYPNLLPELYAVATLMARRFDPSALTLETSLAFALTLVAVREGLRQGGADRFTRQVGLALIALVLGAFGIGYLTAGGADWLLALALAAAVPPLLRPPDRTGDFQLAAIAAFAAASKIEGVPLAAFLLLVQAARRIAGERRLDLRAAGRLSLPALVIVPWLGRALHHHLFLAGNAGAVSLARGPQMVAAVLETVRDTSAWHGFLMAAFLPLPLLFVRRARPLAAVATLQLAFDVYVYLSAPMSDLRYFVLSNFARLGFQLVPASLVVALVVWRDGSAPAAAAVPEAQRGVATPTAGL